MKKRKIKLFASVASLAMVAAVMGVGVWAASTQGLQVNSTVQFSSSAIGAKVELAVTAMEGENSMLKVANDKSASTITPWAAESPTEVDLASGTKYTVADFDIANTTIAAANRISNVAIVLQDPAASANGVIDSGAVITYTFTITADETTSDIYYSVKLSAVLDDWDIKVKLGNAEAAAYTQANSVVYQTTPVAAEGTQDVVITFTANKDLIKVADGGTLTMPNIIIDMAAEDLTPELG